MKGLQNLAFLHRTGQKRQRNTKRDWNTMGAFAW